MRTLLAGTALLLAGWTCTALAQTAQGPDSGTDDPPPEARARTGGTTLKPLEVTGTRLALPDASGPLTVIGRDELEQSGLNRLGEALQRLPWFGGQPLGLQTPRRGEGGGLSRGIETAELRGLGAPRTLVLLNGRRVVPGGNGAESVVDLGMLPLAAVDRIEIYRHGAAVEYGSDAVAGVINVITRDVMHGMALSAGASITNRGDGQTRSLRAIGGRESGRGGWLAGIDYNLQQPISRGDRAFSFARLAFAGPDNTPVFEGSSAPPTGNFRTSGGRLTLIEGRSGTSPDDFRPFTDADRFNFNPFEDLVTRGERVTAFITARHQFDRVQTGFEFFWHRRDSRQRLAPLPFFTNRLADVSVAADQFYNPFDEVLTDVRRRLVEAGPREFSQRNRAARGVLWAEGALGNGYWDVSLTWGRNQTDQWQRGDLLADRVRLALGPSFVDAFGQVRCGTPEQPVDGCVPLNLFGPPGSVTPAMLGWIQADLADHGFSEQSVLEVNWNGVLLELPAGSVDLAAGLQWRRERGAERPDPESRAGNTTGAARAATAGSFEAREAYLEIAVPLLADRSGFGGLIAEGGLRAIDYSNFGARTISDLKLIWHPTAAITIGVSRSEAYRAPGLRELFGGRSQSNPILLDPCADFSALAPEQITRCIDQGVPSDGSFDQTGNETPVLGGGNPALQPEHARAYNAWWRWRPDWAVPLRFGVDWYRIRIRDSIGVVGAQSALDQCLATGQPLFCDAIHRSADGAIEFIDAQLRNLGREQASGLDFSLELEHRLGPGRLMHRLLLSRVLERRRIPFPGADPLEATGRFDPDQFGVVARWRGAWWARWHHDRWSAGYRAQWIDAVREQGGSVFPGTSHRAGSVLYHDLDLSWQATPRLAISIGIDNLTDVQPPLLVTADPANTDPATWRVAGRQFWLRLGLARD